MYVVNLNESNKWVKIQMFSNLFLQFSYISMIILRIQLQCLITVFFIEVDQENGRVHSDNFHLETSETYGTFHMEGHMFSYGWLYAN